MEYRNQIYIKCQTLNVAVPEPPLSADSFDLFSVPDIFNSSSARSAGVSQATSGLCLALVNREVSKTSALEVTIEMSPHAAGEAAEC